MAAQIGKSTHSGGIGLEKAIEAQTPYDDREVERSFRDSDFVPLVACPICNASQVEVIGTKATIHPRSRLCVRIVGCLICKHWYTDPMPRAELLTMLYAESSLSVLGENWAAAVESSNRAQNLAPDSHWVVRGLSKSKPGKLLEVGCGDGGLLRKMRLLGWDAHGVDLGSYAKGFQIVASPSELPGTIRFDAIVFQDVLEHVANPLDVLSSYMRFLSPNAVLLMAVPWSESTKAQKEKESWCMVRPLGHLHYFSKQSVGLLLKASHFDVLRFKTLNIYGSYTKALLLSLLSFCYGIVRPSRWSTLARRADHMARLIEEFPGDSAGDQLCVLARMNR